MKKNELHNKKITEGFSTPKDYFNTFEDRLFGKLEAEAAIPKEEGFKVPDAYFDGLEDRLADKLFAPSTEETKVIPLSNRKIYLKYISYAAAACIIFFGIATNIDFGGESITNPQVTIVDGDINTFIENDLIAMNNYDLVDVFEEENIDISTIFEVDLDEIETIDYLENTADPYDLLIE